VDIGGDLKLNLIYLRSGKTLLSKREYDGWREIQAAYEDYQASLGPWSPEEMLDFLGSEYRNIHPGTSQQIARFVTSDDEVMFLQFT
jgi:hypothetical protein